MLDCSIRMALCCSALTIFDVRLLNGGVTMRLRLVDREAQYRHSAVDLDWLSLRSVVKKIFDGNPKNIHGRLAGKAAPVERQGSPKGMVRLRSDWIVP
jgi:hypothetical protein